MADRDLARFWWDTASTNLDLQLCFWLCAAVSQFGPTGPENGPVPKDYSENFCGWTQKRKPCAQVCVPPQRKVDESSKQPGYAADVGRHRFFELAQTSVIKHKNSQNSQNERPKNTPLHHLIRSVPMRPHGTIAVILGL